MSYSIQKRAESTIKNKWQQQQSALERSILDSLKESESEVFFGHQALEQYIALENSNFYSNQLLPLPIFIPLEKMITLR